MPSNELEAILNWIEAGDHTVEDLVMLRQLLGSQNHSLIQQLDGKYNVHIEQGQNIHIGDRTYVINVMQRFKRHSSLHTLNRLGVESAIKNNH